MRTVASSDGTLLAFDRVGDGPPLVVVPGALNLMSTMLPFAALLRDRFTVVVYDRRGRGGSGDTAPYSIDREIEDLRTIIGEVGGPAYLFANCSGSAIALRAAAAGLDVEALALYEPPFLTGGLHTLPDRYTQRLHELIAQGRRGDALELFMRGGAQLTAEEVQAIRSGPMWAGLQEIAHTLIYDDAQMGDYQLPYPLLEAVQVPALVIDGDLSHGWARHAVARLAEALPLGSRRTLEGHSHLLVPSAIAPVLEEYWSAQDVSATPVRNLRASGDEAA